MNTIEQDIATQMQLEKADQIVRTREDGWTGQSLMRASLRVLAALSQSDAAHERRMLKRQLRRASVEWDRGLPNTADALRDQIRELGLEPMEVCFHRSLECPACVLPAGHEGPHEPTTVKAAVAIEPEPEPEPQKPVRESATNTPNSGLFD